jgi:hypothetical protein
MKVYGYTVKKLYFAEDNETSRFIIFKDENNEIRVFGGNLKKIEYLLAECKYLSEKVNGSPRELFDYQRAIAMNCCFHGEVESSIRILKALLVKLHQRQVIAKKLWYIGVFFLVTVLMIITSISLNQFPYIKYVKVATFGAIGGFISLNLKLQKIKFKISESTISYIIISIYKVAFSMLTSIVCYFLIESELLLGIIKNTTSQNNYFIYAIATLAGFSESLLPNIFKNMENGTGKDNNNKSKESKSNRELANENENAEGEEVNMDYDL